MPDTRYLGSLSCLFHDVPTEDINSIAANPYYGAALGIHNYLSKLQQPDGSLLDPFSQTKLDAQYHLPNFVFASIFFHNITGRSENINRAERAFDYYIQLPNAHKMDISIFALLLTRMILDSQGLEVKKLSSKLDAFIENINYRASIGNDAGQYGNNYVALRMVSQMLCYHLKGREKDKQQAAQISEKVRGWQLKDGIFYDNPRDTLNEQGIPHLAYHAKISMLALLYSHLSNDAQFEKIAFRGLSALTNLIASDGESFYYGRSNNALFAYTCGILAYRLAAALAMQPHTMASMLHTEQRLKSMLEKQRHADGHFSIVLNPLEKRRCGFDEYSHVMVWNAFAMTLLLLSACLKGSRSTQPVMQNDHHTYLEYSGFVSHTKQDIACCINLKGHTLFKYDLLDPRAVALSPLFLKYKGLDLLPTPPYSPKQMTANGNSASNIGGKFNRLAHRLRAAFKKWEYLVDRNPYYAAFVPKITLGSFFFMPLIVDKITETTSELGTKSYLINGRLCQIPLKSLPSLKLALQKEFKRLSPIAQLELYRSYLKASQYNFHRTISFYPDKISFSDDLPLLKNARYAIGVRAYRDWNIEPDTNRILFYKNGVGFNLDGLSVQDMDEMIMCSSKGEVRFLDLHLKPGSISEKRLNISFTLQPIDRRPNDSDAKSIYG